jgi:hypothetical protein
MSCSIRNSQTRPIPGGWSLNYDHNGQAFRITGHSPNAIVERIASIQRANNSYQGDKDIWSYCNAVWEARAPERAVKDEPLEQKAARGIGKSYRHEAERAPVNNSTAHWTQDPAHYGPILWFWLHFFGHSFNKEEWLMTIGRITKILDPDASPGTGCATCFAEWQAIVSFVPPEVVNDEAAAARWSFDAHNRVNKKLKKPVRGWAQCAKLYGWKVTL